MPRIKDERNETNSSFGRGEDEDNHPVATTTTEPEERERTPCGLVVCRSCSSASSAHMFVVLLLLAMSVVVVLAIQLNGKIPAGRMFNGVANGRVHLDDGGDHRNFSGDKTLGGLLAVRNEEQSCRSMHESVLYRRESKYKPSSYLQSRLRRYEAIHKRCAPHTQQYDKFIHHMHDQRDIGDPSTNWECNYVVWIPSYGLGNRMLSLASTFLYALLTDRVLLITRDSDMHDLFCEPFPEGTWLLPTDFPFLDKFKALDQRSPQRYENIILRNKYGNIGRRNANATNMMDYSSLPAPFVYVHLILHGNDKKDKTFFCEQDQLLLQRFRLMVVSSNVYFAPSLFTIPTFEDELSRLFPEKDTVFHHLGRYLFHPANPAWGLITRYYSAYLATVHVEERIGIQIRIFNENHEPFQIVLDQILSCKSSKERILPRVVDVQQRTTSSSSNIGSKSKMIVMTSLSSWYFDKIANMYWEHPTMNGEVVSVYQPSHEEQQQTQNHSHNMKALADIYLLSLTNVLITTPRSTFGYIAQGLAGLEPFVLSTPVKHKSTPEPPCRKDISMEPCLLFTPQYKCKSDQHSSDKVKRTPFIKHCVDDEREGIKLVG